MKARSGRVDFDAVVAGAGPVGATAAREIAGLGHRVLLLEDHAEIGEPLHCSGLVTPRTIELAGAGGELVLNTIKGAYVHHSSGSRLVLGGQRTYALVIDRPRLDRDLAQRAVAEGVELSLRSRLVSIERRDGSLRLGVRGRGGETSVSTRLLVAADGAQSFVARWLGARLSMETLVGLSVEARVTVERADMVQVFLGRNVAPGFFAWLIPVSDGLARIGVATTTGVKPARFLHQLSRTFPAVFAEAEFGRYYGGVIPLTRVEKPYADNVLLVGDAAGQVKPTSGGGIYTGLKGALHAARVGAAALEHGDLSARSLSRYAAAWDRDFRREFSVMKMLRRFFLSLSDAQMERLLKVIQQPALLALANQYGDIDFPSALLRQVMKAPMTPFAGALLRAQP